jgi:fucose 4-O-acetylase-like acetyltransferase
LWVFGVSFFVTLLQQVFALRFNLPYCVEVIPFSVVFVCLGIFSRSFEQASIKWGSLALLLLLLFFQFKDLIHFRLNMKYSYFGIPVLQQVLALVMILVFIEMTKVLVRVPFVSNILQELGKASFIILFVHNAFKVFFLKAYSGVSLPLLIFLILVFSYLFYLVSGKFRLTRVLFRGEYVA